MLCTKTSVILFWFTLLAQKVGRGVATLKENSWPKEVQHNYTSQQVQNRRILLKQTEDDQSKVKLKQPPKSPWLTTNWWADKRREATSVRLLQGRRHQSLPSTQTFPQNWTTRKGKRTATTKTTCGQSELLLLLSGQERRKSPDLRPLPLFIDASISPSRLTRREEEKQTTSEWHQGVMWSEREERVAEVTFRWFARDLELQLRPSFLTDIHPKIFHLYHNFLGPSEMNTYTDTSEQIFQAFPLLWHLDYSSRPRSCRDNNTKWFLLGLFRHQDLMRNSIDYWFTRKILLSLKKEHPHTKPCGVLYAHTFSWKMFPIPLKKDCL